MLIYLAWVKHKSSPGIDLLPQTLQRPYVPGTCVDSEPGGCFSARCTAIFPRTGASHFKHKTVLSSPVPAAASPAWRLRLSSFRCLRIASFLVAPWWCRLLVDCWKTFDEFGQPGQHGLARRLSGALAVLPQCQRLRPGHSEMGLLRFIRYCFVVHGLHRHKKRPEFNPVPLNTKARTRRTS